MEEMIVDINSFFSFSGQDLIKIKVLIETSTKEISFYFIFCLAASLSFLFIIMQPRLHLNIISLWI